MTNRRQNWIKIFTFTEYSMFYKFKIHRIVLDAAHLMKHQAVDLSCLRDGVGGEGLGELSEMFPTFCKRAKLSSQSW